ncbi:tumor necrosis factor receptor superfamily member 6 isoform X2 [Dendrobates tinctorius]|uniref:tumor necrosis factor receptor superfamily member 6 isoform X2 n=1 Tax=Dendrobates tinctorius TaxID=92724 RepID=UPI003CC9B56C
MQLQLERAGNLGERGVAREQKGAAQEQRWSSRQNAEQALILNFVVFAENSDHNTTDRGIKKNVDYSILHKLRKREIHCPDGEYRAVNHCCKLCNAGTYAKSDCEQDHGAPTCSSCIDGSTYMNTKNGEHSCRICTPCDSVLEELSACTVTRNFVCKCKEDFFCTENISAESDGCTQCQHCTKCEHGFAERCSAIKDAVCNPSGRTYYAFIALVLLVVLITVICYFCRKLCNPDPPSYTPVRRKSFPEELKDIIPFTTLRNLLPKLGITEIEFETIQRNNPNDNEEQKFQLLRSWYQGHGRSGAFQELIMKLQEASRQQTVEALIDKARAQLQQSQA